MFLITEIVAELARLLESTSTTIRLGALPQTYRAPFLPSPYEFDRIELTDEEATPFFVELYREGVLIRFVIRRKTLEFYGATDMLKIDRSMDASIAANLSERLRSELDTNENLEDWTHGPVTIVI